MRDAHERTFSSGQVIMLAREPCQAVYLVAQGVLRAYQASLEGREHVLAYLGPGDLFNVVPALDGGSVPANVDALTDVTLLAIPCDRFGAIVRNHQVVAMAVLQHLAADVRRLGEMVEGLALHTVRARLARFLLSRAADRQSPDQWTQEKIATHIGTVRDVVGRTLRDLAREGLIRQERGRLVVRDRQGLEREAMNE